MLAFGRYAPFYHLVYALPYASTIRNPVKFLYPVSVGLVVLFAYGIDGLWRKYMQVRQPAGASTASSVPISQRRGGRPGMKSQPWAGLRGWWAKAPQFDKRWVCGCLLALAASLVGWLAYAASGQALRQYLESVQFSGHLAREIADFSVRQVGWFVLLFALAAGLVIFILSGAFAGARVRWGGILLGALLVVDLGRANLPWIIYWDYERKYASNPIIDELRNKPYEHRVANLPFVPPPRHALLDQLYRLEWLQHQLPFYNVQTLDSVQMPRMPEDVDAFEKTFTPTGDADIARLVSRRWQLTNARYLLGPAEFLNTLNQRVDAAQHRLRIAERFDLAPGQGIARSGRLEELTAVPAADGPYALFEFTGALPRAKLYSDWQASANNTATLQELASAAFEPGERVLVADPLPAPAGAASAARSGGTVEFASYAPKQIVFKSDAPASSVLLLNDRFDANWKVLVDGRPERLLRCNFLMRGVYLTAGAHTVEFRFQPPVGLLYVSLAANALGILLLGFVIVVERRGRLLSPEPAWNPHPALRRLPA